VGLLLLVGSVAVRASGGLHLQANVLSSAGRAVASTSYRINATLGQGSAVGMSTGTGYRLLGGYVPRAPQIVRVRLPLISAP